MIDAYEYYKNMDESDILLLFKGNITSDLVSSILKITESKLESIEDQPKTKRRVFNILVECLQNVYHHLDERDEPNSDDFKSAILMLGRQGDTGYVIITGNYIFSDRVADLTERLNALNAMDKEELRAEYQNVLSNEGFSEKGGAGLGFIDMLRKSGQKLEFGFQEVDDQYSFFTINIKA